MTRYDDVDREQPDRLAVPYAASRASCVPCQSGEIQPIHCSQIGSAASGKTVPENRVIGSTMKPHHHCELAPVLRQDRACTPAIGRPNAEAGEHRDRDPEHAPAGTAPRRTEASRGSR